MNKPKPLERPKQMRLCNLIFLYVLLASITVLDLRENTSFAANTLKPNNKSNHLSETDITKAKIIQKLIKKRKWSLIKKNIFKIKNPLLKDALLWQYYILPNSGAKFYEIVNLIKDKPNWPLITRLRQRAEEAMSPKMDAADIITWFKYHEPITVDGSIRLGEAFFKTSRIDGAKKVIRKAWVTGDFGAKQERQFYKRYRRFLTKEDHHLRLERLLWKGRYYPVRRMLHKVNKDYRALAFARITLRQYRGAVDNAISKVPTTLLDNSGLIYERLRWRRRKGRDSDAIEMLHSLQESLKYPEYWWTEKSILARRALQNGNISVAYNLAKNHGLENGQSFVEAEWLAGWISMRFLNESAVALEHFKSVFKGSKYPISRARGAYWAGRASEELNDQKKTANWYKKAAAYSLTYYGQHAITKLSSEKSISRPVISKKTVSKEFVTHELVKVVRILGKAKLFDLINPFIKQLNNLKSSANWYNSVAILARENGRPDLAIYTSKKAYRAGFTLIDEGYPTLNISFPATTDLPLLYALIRQESAFNVRAVSHAGARGLMQIMPSTAKRVARKFKKPYRKHKLTSDINYNLELGQNYLSGLLKQFKGSHILALAAYNAGPSRAKSWIKRNGDPRIFDVDKIDWVEMVPFKETRNYVQRVIENYNVYRKHVSLK